MAEAENISLRVCAQRCAAHAVQPCEPSASSDVCEQDTALATYLPARARCCHVLFLSEDVGNLIDVAGCFYDLHRNHIYRMHTAGEQVFVRGTRRRLQTWGENALFGRNLDSYAPQTSPLVRPSWTHSRLSVSRPASKPRGATSPR